MCQVRLRAFDWQAETTDKRDGNVRDVQLESRIIRPFADCTELALIQGAQIIETVHRR